MTTTGWVIVLIVAIAITAAAVWFLTQRTRRRHLEGRFGPEYERAVSETGSRTSAERLLEQREERVAALDIRPLAPEERERYAAEWKQVQAQFVDTPSSAVEEADRLIAEVMQHRGYPVGDFERRADDLSVDHPRVVQHYRAGHDLALRSRDGRAETEDLRQAMVHYRALFDDLLSTDGRRDGTAVEDRARTRHSSGGVR